MAPYGIVPPRLNWEAPGSTAEEIDVANEATTILATEWEARAKKIAAYTNEWTRTTPDQQNRSLILALAG